jgi:hypothetical protein
MSACHEPHCPVTPVRPIPRIPIPRNLTQTCMPMCAHVWIGNAVGTLHLQQGVGGKKSERGRREGIRAESEPCTAWDRVNRGVLILSSPQSNYVNFNSILSDLYPGL